jgi:hypothetical protein
MIIIVDIDDTLADTSHREHLIQSEGWDAFHEAGKEDKPIKAMVDLIEALHCDPETVHEIIALTARPEKYRQQTLAQDYFGELFSQISLVIDDHEEVCAAFRAHGITCLQVLK